MEDADRTIEVTLNVVSESVDIGDDYTFTITPISGYEIENLLIDGELVAPQGIYTFEDIDKDHSIAARYVEQTTDDRTTISSLTLVKFDYAGNWRTTYQGPDSTFSIDFVLTQDKGIDYIENSKVVIAEMTDKYVSGNTNQGSIYASSSDTFDVGAEIVVRGDSFSLTLDGVFSLEGTDTRNIFTKKEININDFKNVGNDYYPNLYSVELVNPGFLAYNKLGESTGVFDFSKITLYFLAEYTSN
jgi:hypothetical protein